MGYTSRYEGTQKIELSDGYWVEVRLCLTGQQFENCRKRLVTYRIISTDEGWGATLDRVDPAGLSREIAVASLVSWNIDDDEGNILPLIATDADGKELGPDHEQTIALKRTQYGLLTPVDQDKVEEVVMRLNELPTKQEAATFPEGRSGGDPAGTVTESDGRQVLP